MMKSNIQNKKESLRKKINEDLGLIPKRAFDEAGILICSYFKEWLPSINMKNHNIAGFINFKKEINTVYINNFLEKANFNIFIPKIDQEKKMLLFFLLSKEDNNKYEISPELLSVIIIPGLAFDLLGNRLGRGYGYYDRFLVPLNKKIHRPITIGLAMDEQIVEKVPNDENDINMDFICTPKLGIKIVKRN